MNHLFEAYDVNNDGLLSLPEFKPLITSIFEKYLGMLKGDEIDTGDKVFSLPLVEPPIAMPTV